MVICRLRNRRSAARRGDNQDNHTLAAGGSRGLASVTMSNTFLSKDLSNATEAALEAANAMPPDPSDFDKGLAAGMTPVLYRDKTQAVEPV
jgi:hypothetical protein